jgi:hypothetical protein
VKKYSLRPSRFEPLKFNLVLDGFCEELADGKNHPHEAQKIP